jgi:long-chain acyl-CoA synthetase
VPPAANAWRHLAQRRGQPLTRPVGVDRTAPPATSDDSVAEVEGAVRAANEHLARVEQVTRFKLLPDEWTVETGELTPTLKRRRRVIAERYAAVIERLYDLGAADVVDLSRT